jgi:DNA-dependent protein kinase catalytic subunit
LGNARIIYNVYTQVIDPVVAGFDYHKKILFFQQIVKDLLQRIQEPPARKLEDLEAQFRIKACCYKLLKLAYIGLNFNDLNTKSGTIVNAIQGKDADSDTYLTKIIIKHAHDSKKELSPTGEPVTLRSARRLYHQAAYQCLCEVIILTQNKENFFVAFLFKENPAKGELLWDNIVDTNVMHISLLVGTHLS